MLYSLQNKTLFKVANLMNHINTLRLNSTFRKVDNFQKPLLAVNLAPY